jgi:hypothetical protein
MKIDQPRVSTLDRARIKQDLLRLIAQPVAAESPPCVSCGNHVPANCSSKCAQAAASLSSEPARYPVEIKVVPLVFELAATRVMQPCWSCEGHLGPNGELWKLPQVSFYAESPLYPQLLLKHIHALELQKRLTYPWHVVLSDYGQTWDTTYTLEPNLSRQQAIHLGNLQADLNALAENLNDRLKAIARSALAEIT